MFATLVTSSGDAMVASHLPFVADFSRGPNGTLYAHMARANPQASILEDGSDCLVIFNGPHGYISPSWYSDRATAPTWDYAAAHCYGKVVLHDAVEAELNIERLISVVEFGGPAPWTMTELQRIDIDRMIANILSFEIRLDRVEAKFKLNQGEMPERTASAIERLRKIGNSALADYVRRYNDTSENDLP